MGISNSKLIQGNENKEQQVTYYMRVQVLFYTTNNVLIKAGCHYLRVTLKLVFTSDESQ